MMDPKDPGQDLRLTHLDAHGAARMVDVTDKPETARMARAKGRVFMKPETLRRITEGGIEKGDALAVARLAGIQAVKRTADVIPLCHPLRISGVQVALTPRQTEATPDAPAASEAAVDIEATVWAVDRTGVEMEALHAVTIAALSLYDMCKAIDRGMCIKEVRLVEKRGGRSGAYFAEGES